MIVEFILNAIVGLVELVFGWISLPEFPAGLAAMVTEFEDLMFSSATMLSLLVRVSTVTTLVPLVLIVANFDKVWRFTLFVLRKLPFGIG